MSPEPTEGFDPDELAPWEEEGYVRNSDDSDDKKEKASAATQLVGQVEDNYTLGLSTDGRPYALPKKGPKIVRMLRGNNGLRQELAMAYFRTTRKAAPAQALKDALGVIEGMAGEEDPEDLHLRVAEFNGRTYIDLGDDTGRAVEVDRHGWRLVHEAPVLFRRTVLTAPLPEPAPGGSIDDLWDFINVPTEDRPLVVAYLLSLFVPDVPHVVLLLSGEQGAAKSTAARIIVSITDPSNVPLRKPPRDPEGWITAASASWVVCVDNVSDIKDWWSDSLCRASTGDGDVRRTLFADDDVTMFVFRRCPILTAIDTGAMAGDLAERVLPIHLHTIDPANRREESEIGPAWEEARPRIFGALLDGMAGVAGISSGLVLESRPRMADFARVVAAADQLYGTQGLERYVRSQSAMAGESLTGDTFITAVMGTIGPEGFVGTSAELLRLVPEPESKKKEDNWPSTSRAVTQTLRRQAPVLRKVGWKIDDDGGRNKNSTITWTLQPPQQEIDRIAHPPHPPDPSSQVSGDVESAGTGGYGGDGGSDPARPFDDTRPEKGPLTREGGDGGHGGDEIQPLSGRVTEVLVEDSSGDPIAWLQERF